MGLFAFNRARQQRNTTPAEPKPLDNAPTPQQQASQPRGRSSKQSTPLQPSKE